MKYDYLDGPKGEMLRLLERDKGRTGLTATAIRTIVEGSSDLRKRWIPGLPGDDDLPFLLGGVAKLVCSIRDDDDVRRLTIDLLGPGSFLCRPPVVLGPWLDANVAIRIHDGPLQVMRIPRAVMAKALAGLPQPNLSVFESHVWQLGMGTLCSKSALLFLMTGDRLVHELCRLAARMGQVEDDTWIRIDVRLTQGDVADLIGRARARVNKPWQRLERAGLLRATATHLLVARTLLRRNSRSPEKRRRGHESS